MPRRENLELLGDRPTIGLLFKGTGTCDEEQTALIVQHASD